MKKGTKVLKLIENWASGQRVWYVVNAELITEQDLLYVECSSIINWKLLHTNVDFGLVEISEGEYGN